MSRLTVSYPPDKRVGEAFAELFKDPEREEGVKVAREMLKEAAQAAEAEADEEDEAVAQH